MVYIIEFYFYDYKHQTIKKLLHIIMYCSFMNLLNTRVMGIDLKTI